MISSNNISSQSVSLFKIVITSTLLPLPDRIKKENNKSGKTSFKNY